MSALKPRHIVGLPGLKASKPKLQVDEFCPKCGVAKFANWPHKCLLKKPTKDS
jgi:hypothetical protein